MKTTALKTKPEKVEYQRFWFIGPKNLLTLSKEYQVVASKLIAHLKENPSGSILFKRLVDGSIREKTISGTVKDIKENSFTFSTPESLDNGTIYENLHEIYARTDNVLGWIPFLPSSSVKNMNPYKNHICEETKEFFDFLATAKILMKKCVGKIHKATLCCWLDNYGRELVDCKILKVNRSNIEIKQYRSTIIGKSKNITLSRTKRVILFLEPKGYLQKVEVFFDSEHDISPFDDGEKF